MGLDFLDCDLAKADNFALFDPLKVGKYEPV